MQQLTLALRPENGPFSVPFSTGYQTYSGLLSTLSTVDVDLADTVHEAEFSSLTNSGLQGDFGWDADREYHKTVRDTEYELRLGITHPDDTALFEALVRAFVIQDQTLPLSHGDLAIESVESRTATHETLLSEAQEAVEDGASGVRIRFVSPTCRQRYGEIWETSPDRTALFRHLAERWNATVPSEDLELALVEETLGKEVYCIPSPDTYQTHSIVVHRREHGESNTQNDAPSPAPDGGVGDHLTEAQGFTGEWTYRFKNASTATKNAVLALAQFAEFAGVGRHTARGAGTVETDIEGG